MYPQAHSDLLSMGDEAGLGKSAQEAVDTTQGKECCGISVVENEINQFDGESIQARSVVASQGRNWLWLFNILAGPIHMKFGGQHHAAFVEIEHPFQSYLVQSSISD